MREFARAPQMRYCQVLKGTKELGSKIAHMQSILYAQSGYRDRVRSQILLHFRSGYRDRNVTTSRRPLSQSHTLRVRQILIDQSGYRYRSSTKMPEALTLGVWSNTKHPDALITAIGSRLAPLGIARKAVINLVLRIKPMRVRSFLPTCIIRPLPAPAIPCTRLGCWADSAFWGRRPFGRDVCLRNECSCCRGIGR